ncbi:sensor histidine kinase [Allostreptomyces psammosilenae]|uniref:histidine kinase n=1 Tax=Allostreptomyces psammosilenae TaxID=1892865 RepID=A0A853A5K1_9ACTN|nr:histidine kinase [Allostreptomyces psammosilenae]NYI05808.1 signal transduction histidine kinase [Allostreptomyces psammosilenae]
MSLTGGNRRTIRAGAVGAAGAGGGVWAVVAVEGPGLPGRLSATVAVAVALWALGCWPWARDRLARPLAGAATLSLLTTLGWSQSTPVEEAGVWKLVEVAALLAVLVPVVRRSPRRSAAVSVGLTAVAVALWTVPLVETGSWLERAGAAALWSLPVLMAAVAGGYPRWAARRARLAVTEARRLQQLELARELHDFVAHDVSAIVVQAQAARFVAESDPDQAAQAVLALERIERAGLSALASMDRTVRALQQADGGPAAPPALRGVDQLPELVERFAAEGRADCRYTAEPGAAEALSREAGAAAYRLVVEALTNVRRHAPDAARVEVAIRRSGTAAVEVSVANDAPSGSRTGPSALLRRRAGHGGTGLAGLREHVTAGGGTLTAGPVDGGWRVVAVFPRTAS